MSKKKHSVDLIKQEEEYILFLKKKLKSENYKLAVSAEEYKKTELKYDKAKLKLKFLREI